MHENYCKVKITGGLGNQLFKFTNGLRIANHFDSELILDTSFYELVSGNTSFTTPRHFELDYFPQIAKMAKMNSSQYFRDRLAAKLMRESPRIIRSFSGYFTENDNLNDFNHVKWIDGSFEDLAYMPAFSKIRHFLQFPEKQSQWLSTNLGEMSEQQPISIHVRLTDFLKVPELYGVMNRDYYLKSLDYFQKVFPNHPTWLFSDDPEGALKFLGDEFRFDRILGPDEESSSAEVLNLLSNSFGICTANSTFSWWGGFLGSLNGNTKYVSIPRSFNTLSSDYPEKKLLLPGWHLL